MEHVDRFLFSLGFALFSNVFLAIPVISQDHNLLCTKFPLNSRCQNDADTNRIDQVGYTEYQLDRDTFCAEYSFNAHCQSDPVEIINFNLQEEEWIRIKKSGNRIELAHSERTKDGLVSLITDEALGLIPLPGFLDDYSPFGVDDLLPVDLNQYGWEDDLVIQVTFKQDNCKADDCAIVGKNTIDLPERTNVFEGLFTVEYQEGDFKRSVTFRIPNDVEVNTVKTIIIRVPN